MQCSECQCSVVKCSAVHCSVVKCSAGAREILESRQSTPGTHAQFLVGSKVLLSSCYHVLLFSWPPGHLSSCPPVFLSSFFSWNRLGEIWLSDCLTMHYNVFCLLYSEAVPVSDQCFCQISRILLDIFQCQIIASVISVIGPDHYHYQICSSVRSVPVR